MRFRFTLTHPESGNSLEISEPDGWKDCALKLDRHDDFHSLIEYFEGSFIFYGDNGQINGGVPFIRALIRDYGIDTSILIDIDLTFDELTFSSVFNGQLGIQDSENLPKNKMRIPIIREDFWSKFIARMETPVDIQSTLNLDDEPVSATDKIQINLSSQVIVYEGSYEWLDSFTYYEEDDAFGDGMTGLQLDWDVIGTDDLKKFTLPRARFQVGNVANVVPPNSLFGNFEAPYDGDYTFNILFYGSFYVSGIDLWIDNVTQIDFHVLKTTQTQITTESYFDKTVITCGSDSIVEFSFNKTLTLFRGEQVKIFGIESSTQPGFTIFGTQRLEWHNVVVATTAPVALSGEQTIDGIVTNTSDILVKNQVDPAENGIYVTGAGAWTRATYADSEIEVSRVAAYVTLGDTNANTGWKMSGEISIIDVDAQNWVFITLSDERLRPFPCSFDVENTLLITADTVFAPTAAEGFLLHDIFAAISDRITGQENSFYSELTGAPFTRKRQYENIGCASSYGLMKGLHVRRYTLEEKPYFQSFKQAWLGADPILNLSLGYDENGIRLEDKKHQYDDSEGTSIDFLNVNPAEISSKYDVDRIFNRVSVGYARWQAEDISGLDDPQAKKTYHSRFKTVGKGVELYSEWIGASSAFESARRTTRDKSTDYKFDNETYILALNPNFVDESPDTSPDVLIFSPELSENFLSVTDLISPETRYNLKLTPARNFLRWQNFLQGCLQDYPGSSFKFSSGEGNYRMKSVMQENGCLNEDFNEQELDESGEIPITNDFLHLPDLFSIEIPMEWEEYETIRDNRRKPIGISTSDDNSVPMFIKTLSYRPAKGTATILAWAKEYLDLSINEDTFATQECYLSDECADALLTDLGDILTDELGVCLTD